MNGFLLGLLLLLLLGEKVEGGLFGVVRLSKEWEESLGR